MGFLGIFGLIVVFPSVEIGRLGPATLPLFPVRLKKLSLKRAKSESKTQKLKNVLTWF